MDLYIDLSILVSILLSLTCLLTLKILTLDPLHKGLSILFILFHGFLFFLVYINPFLAYLVYFLFVLGFMFVLSKQKRIIHFLIYMCFYCSLSVLVSCLNNGVRFYNFALIITSPEGLITSLLIPLFGVMLCFSSLLVDKFYHLRNYTSLSILYIESIRYELKGYYDTGNTLRYKNIPVIFLSDKTLIDNNIFKEEISFESVNGISVAYATKGLISLKNDEDYYVVYVALKEKEEGYHGCPLLLNAYLF